MRKRRNLDGAIQFCVTLSLFFFLSFLTNDNDEVLLVITGIELLEGEQPCSSSEIRLDGSSHGSVLECLRLGFVEM